MKASTSTTKVVQPPEESSGPSLSLKTSTTNRSGSANTNSFNYSNNNGVNDGGASNQQSSVVVVGGNDGGSSSATTPLPSTTTNNESESDAFVIKREDVLITDMLYKLHRRSTKLVDTHVICQDGYIPVHRCVLMACSSFLWELLVHEDPAELATVCLPDYTVEQVLPLLNSFYTGCIIFNKSELTSTLEIIAMLKADSISYNFHPAMESDKRWAPKMRHYLESKDSNKQQSQHKNDNQLQARLGSGATMQRKSPKLKPASSSSSKSPSTTTPLKKQIDPSTQQTSIASEETEASNRAYTVQNESSTNGNNSDSNSPIEVDIEEIEEDEEEEQTICHYEENSDEEVEMELLTPANLNIEADIEEVSDTFEDDNNVFSPVTADLVNDVIIRPEATTVLLSDEDERDPLEFESLLVDEDFVEESDSLHGRTFEFETIAFDEDGQHKQIAQIITEPLQTTPRPSPPEITMSVVKTIAKSQKTKKSMKEKKQERRRRTTELKRLATLRKEQAELELRSQEAEKRQVGEEERLQRRSFSGKRRDDEEEKLLKAQEQRTRMEEKRFSQELQDKIQKSLASGRYSQVAAAVVEDKVPTENHVVNNNSDKEPLQSPVVEENRRVLRGRDKGRVATIPRPTTTEEPPTTTTRRQSNERVKDSQKKLSASERSKAEKEKRLQEENEKRLREEKEKRLREEKEKQLREEKEKRIQEEKEKQLQEEKEKRLQEEKEKRVLEEKQKEKRLQEEEEKRSLRSKQAENEKETKSKKVGDRSKKSDNKHQIKNLSINLEKINIPKAEEEQRKLQVEKEKQRLVDVTEKQVSVVAEEEKRRTSEREQKRKRVEELKRVKAEEQRKLKAEKELQSKKAEEARRQKDAEELRRRKAQEEELRRKAQLEEAKRKEAEEEEELRKVIEKQEELARKVEDETRRKKEEEKAHLKELEDKRIEDELNLKIEESMKKAGKISATGATLTSSSNSTTTTVPVISQSKEEPSVTQLTVTPVSEISVLPNILSTEKSHTPNEQPRRKTTKFYEDLFQKRKQAEEERRRKQREEEEQKKQQEQNKAQEEAKNSISEGNEAEKAKAKVSAKSVTTAEPIIASGKESESSHTVESSVPAKEESSSKNVVSESSPSVVVDTESVQTAPSKSSSPNEESPEQAVECTEDKSAVTTETTKLSEVPLSSEEQRSSQDEQDLEAPREVLVDSSSISSAEPQQVNNDQIYEFVDDIPLAIQETVVVTTDDYFSMEMESDTINEVEVETEESGFNSGSVGRNSSEDGDDRASYEKVLEGCEQTLRPEQPTKTTLVDSTPDATTTTSGTDDPVPTESLVPEQEKESVAELAKSKSENESDSVGGSGDSKQRRKKKKNRKVREKHTQTKPQQQKQSSGLNLFTPDIVLSTEETGDATTVTPKVSPSPGEDVPLTPSASWTTSQGDGGTKLCIKRSSMDPMNTTAAAVALARNPTRRFKVLSPVTGKVCWVQNPKVVLSRLSKRQCKYYSNRFKKYLAGRTTPPPPTLTKAVGSKLTTNSSPYSASKKSVKKLVLHTPVLSRPLSSSASVSVKSKSVVRSVSYDTDVRPPRLEPQLPSSSSSKPQKRPASVPQSRGNYERRSFSSSPSFAPNFDPVWYQEELKRCANCKRKYRVHTKATNCLLNHGFRRCWICLDLLPSHDASYEQHCAKFHTVDNQRDRVQCPICGKNLMMRGLPMHVTRKHLQPPTTVIPQQSDVIAQQDQSQMEILQQLYRPQPVNVFNPHHMQQQQLYGHDQFYHQQPPFHTGMSYPPPPSLMEQPPYQPPQPLMNQLYPQPLNHSEIIQPIKLDLKKIDRSRERIRLSESESENDSDNGTTTTRTSTPSDLDEIDNTSLSSPLLHPLSSGSLPSITNDIYSQQLDFSVSKQSSVITHGPHISSKYAGRAHSPISSVAAPGSLYAFKESNVGVPIQLIPNPSTTYIDEELARRAYQQQYPVVPPPPPLPVEPEPTPATPVTTQANDLVAEPQIEQEPNQDQDQLLLPQPPLPSQPQSQTSDASLSPVADTTNNTDIMTDDELTQRAYQYPIEDSTTASSPQTSPQKLDQQQPKPQQELHHHHHQQQQQQSSPHQQEQHQPSPVEHHHQQEQQQHQPSPVEYHHQQDHQQQQQQHHHQQQQQQQYQEQQFNKHSIEPIQHIQHQVAHTSNRMPDRDREREHHMKRHNMHKVDNIIQPKKRILSNYESYPGHFEQQKLEHLAHHPPPYFPSFPTHTPYYHYPSGRDPSNSRISGAQVPPPAHGYGPLPSLNPHLHHPNQYHQRQPVQHSLDRYPMANQDVTMDETGNSYRELRNVNYAASPILLSYNSGSVGINGPKAIPAPATDYDGGNGIPRPSLFDTPPPLPNIMDEPERQQQHHQQQHQHQHHVIQQLWDHGSLRTDTQPQTQNPLSHLSLEYINRNASPDDGLQCTRCGENFYMRENLDSHRCSYN